MTRGYTALIWQENNMFFAKVPDFDDGCITQGATFEEACCNITEALCLVVQTMQEKHFPLPVASKYFDVKHTEKQVPYFVVLDEKMSSVA